MFCSKCGAKAIEGAVFCEKCGAKMVDDAGSTMAKRPVQMDMREVAEPMVSEASKTMEKGMLEIQNTFEAVSAGDIYNLLQESVPNCPEIKKIDFWQKQGITKLVGKKNQYYIGFSRGEYRLTVYPAFLFSVPRIILLFAYCFILSLLFGEFDFEEMYFLPGWLLLIGGVSGAIVSSVICRKEKKQVVPFIKEALSNAVCVKASVAHIIEPIPMMLNSHLMFLGLPLHLASIIEPIVCAVAALAGIVVLTAGSGVLDNIGALSYNESGYDAYNDKPKTDQYMPSSDVENILLSNEYTNEEEGFSFKYPYDWEIEDVEEVNPDALVSVACTGMFGTYARLAVMKEADDGSFFAAEKSDFETAYSSETGLSDVKVMDLSDMVLDGCRARKLTFAANIDGVRMIWIQYFYIRDYYIYLVTCVVEADNYDSYEPRFKAIMDSYTITAANEAALSFDASEIISMYVGSWWDIYSQRANMKINYVDANGGYFDISIRWSSSASELTEWYLEGINENGGIHYYGQQVECYFNDSNEGAETRVVSEAEEGFLWIGNDNMLYWDNYNGEIGRDCVFEKSVY